MAKNITVKDEYQKELNLLSGFCKVMAKNVQR